MNTLIQLCEKKSPYLTITRTPTHWTVAGKDPEAEPVEYQSIEDCLINFILTQTGSDSGQKREMGGPSPEPPIDTHRTQLISISAI